MKKRYALGLDYGTLSVRAVLVDADTGEAAGCAEFRYPHGVMTDALPDGTPLPADFALAHPQDYLDGLYTTVRQVLRESGAAAEQVVGIGLDATSSSVLPLDDAGSPLCFHAAFASHPHAYIKLWKHHAAADWGKKIEESVRRRQEPWLAWYGGQVNCELMLPKALETQAQDPSLWDACTAYLEISDWLCSTLTGRLIRSHAIASCNTFYRDQGGYPSDAFFAELAPGKPPVTRKFIGELLPLGASAGRLCEAEAEKLGLPAGIPVAVPMIDSHASMPGCGADAEGDVVAVIGTSACYLMNGTTANCIPGIYSVAWQTCVPNLYSYEGGQSCAGDAIGWFMRCGVPAEYAREAEERHLSLYDLLCEKCAPQEPGQSGLLALDWWNGVRSPLMQPNQTGLLAGLTLATRPEEIYRAYLEAICYGARRILETFEQGGHPVKRLFAAGGIPAKNPFMMQLLADITGKSVLVADGQQTSAQGSAILGAAAASGADAQALAVCIQRMHLPVAACYEPNPSHCAKYETLYARYRALTEIFAANDLLQNRPAE